MPEHKALGPFEASSGPRNARIALVGEAFGEQEALLGKPFAGSSGQELTRLLGEAGIKRSECFLTNVIACRPYTMTEVGPMYSNNFDLFCGSKAEVGGRAYTHEKIKQGKYLRPEFFSELDRLHAELSEVRPNIVVALGGKASWALLGNSAISRIRGTVAPSTFVPGLKVLPTYHPSYLFQVWSDRPVVLVDLKKALRESEFPEFRRPEREVVVSPTLSELAAWVDATLAKPPALLSCDIETTGGQIESIGFARSRKESLVCPFILRSPLRSYWPSEIEELAAREQCQRLLASGIPLLGQNFLYDMQYLLRENFVLANVAHDTMLRHHVMYPELQKGLGFLGSIYTNEPAWKLMRHRKKEEELKRDE